jgi:alanine racemase
MGQGSFNSIFMILSSSELIKIVHGNLIRGLDGEFRVNSLVCDSRNPVADPNSLFIALKGSNFDGHDFAFDAYQKGVRNFLLERIPESIHSKSNVNILIVPDCRKALQQIAAFHRQKFSYPVIGITGSNGKTIVKEWLTQLLEDDYLIVKSPKSFNSQIGVPLSVLEMTSSHRLGIFEAGISVPSEMQNLEEIIRPEIGIFTNIGTAHDEGFDSRTQKALEKANLFQRSKSVIACADHPLVLESLKKLNGPELILWSTEAHAKAKYQFSVALIEGQTKVMLAGNGLNTEFRLPFSEDASLQNIFHCIICLLELGGNSDAIQDRISRIKTITSRLELKEGINQSYLIDDSYTNDLEGLKIALNYFNSLSIKPKKTLILSDFGGDLNPQVYEEVKRLLNIYKINRLIGVGPNISKCFEHDDRIEKCLFKSTDHLLEGIHQIEFHNELILIKGARKFRLEKIVRQLERKTHATYLEIDFEAMVQNLSFFKSKLKPETKLMVMVKAFAYGSGLIEIGRFLQNQGVNYLAVAYADEGVLLRKNGITMPIMVMNTGEENFEQLLRYNLEPEIYSLKMLRNLIEYLRGSDKKLKVHVNLDTGMHRLGFLETDLQELANLLKASNDIETQSIYTHLAASEDPEHDNYSIQQLSRFNSWSRIFTELKINFNLRHVLNTGGVLRFPDFQFEMVRLGIGLYGVDVTKNHKGLKLVGSLKTTISQIKNIAKDETIGYSRSGKLYKNSTIAIIPIGYADGFDRRLGNGIGRVWLGNKVAPVIGNVCMDMTMIDITDIDANEGDEVVIFDSNRSISELLKGSGISEYEFLVGLGERVNRVYYV